MTQAYGSQGVALLVAVAAPLGGATISGLGLGQLPALGPGGVGLTLALASGALAWAFWRLRGSDLVSRARDAILENLEDGVLVLDPEGRIADANPAAEAIVGEQTGRLIGKQAAEVFAEWPDVLELLQKGQSGGDEVMLKDEGSRRVLEVRVFPFSDQRERRDGRLVVLRDVSEREDLAEALQAAQEAAEAADEAKSEFMSVASHEMRTPITCIKGYTDLLAKLMRDSVDDEHIEFLDTIRVNADRLAGLVSDLSDMARLESGRLQLVVDRVHLERVIAEAIRDIGARIREKDQLLIDDVPSELPVVQGDYDSLVRVMINLLSNAHKFTPAGGQIRVFAEVLNSEEEGAAVHVAISDSGIGIQAEELDRVFEKFYRSEDREASQRPGSGLGLSIASELIEMQGGRIWLESTFREGTTVHFTVPVARRSEIGRRGS